MMMRSKLFDLQEPPSPGEVLKFPSPILDNKRDLLALTHPQWGLMPFQFGSLMAAVNQQLVDLSKAFLHFNPIDRGCSLEQELRGEPCQQQILITDNIDGAFT